MVRLLGIWGTIVFVAQRCERQCGSPRERLQKMLSNQYYVVFQRPWR